jgi:hypothetical protein
MRYSIPFFNFFAVATDKTIHRDGIPQFCEALNGFQEMNLTATMDISTPWKGFQKGGACKQSPFFVILALLNLIMVIIPMKLNAIIFVLIDGMKIGFVPIMITQQIKQSKTQKKTSYCYSQRYQKYYNSLKNLQRLVLLVILIMVISVLNTV